MANNIRWREGGGDDISGTEGRLTRFRDITKSFLKKFGPLIMTGLVAVAEHHWLEHKDRDESDGETRARDLVDERDDKSSIRELREEVAKLRRSLKRKARDGEEDRERGSTSNPPVSSNFAQDQMPPYQEVQPREQYFRGRPFENERPLPLFPQHYEQIPGPRRRYSRHGEEPFDPSRYSRGYVDRPNQRDVARRIHHHRHSSVPNRRSYEDEISDEAMHAGKVAALAGFVEAIHVGDLRGDWLGPKGVRVGTTMAASYGASYSRDRDPDEFRRREVIADVGTGLLVSRLVHGSTRRIEENSHISRRGRRWSYCY